MEISWIGVLLAFVAGMVVAMAWYYLLGVSTRRMDKLVGTLGISGLPKSQVSEMAKELDTAVVVRVALACPR